MNGRVQLVIGEQRLNDLVGVRTTERVEHVRWDAERRVLVVTLASEFAVDVAPGAYLPEVDRR